MDKPDPVMATVRARFEKSQMTYDQLGEKMGYPKATGRKMLGNLSKRPKTRAYRCCGSLRRPWE